MKIMKEEKILESLSPNERRILPNIEAHSLIEISKKSNLDKISTLRSLEYLQNKGLTMNGAPMEVYVTDPMLEKDTTKWITEVYYPVIKN